MTVRWTSLPASAWRSTGTSDPRRGVLVTAARPSRGQGFALTQDLLASLGADPALEGAGRRRDDDVEVLHAWMLAYDVRLVVVRLANNLGAKDAFDTLCDTVGRSGADLLLVCDEVWDRRLDALLDERGAVRLPSRDLPGYLRDAARAPGPADGPPEDDDGFPVVLPDVDEFRFRARCRDCLPAEEFALVDALYARTVREVVAAAPTSTEAARTLFERLAAGLDHPGKVLTVVRALQVGTFAAGRQTKVDLPELRRAVADGRHRRLTGEEVRRLRAYRTPWRSCAAVLHDADLTVAAMTALTVADVAEDGAPTVEHLPIHPDALVYLRAQRLLRVGQDADPADPFLDRSELYVARTLRNLGRDLLLPFMEPNAAAATTRSERWRYTHGLTLLPLTGAMATLRESA